MLRIIEGGAKTGKSTWIQTELLRLARQEGENTLLLFVPEQFSFETERAYVEALGLSMAGRVQVVSFQRFSENIFREFGGLAGEYAAGTAKLLSMKLALRQCASQLGTYGRLAARPDFPQKMVEAVAELKRAGLSGEELDKASAALPAGDLHNKLADLSLLWAVYEGVLSLRYLDELDDLSRAAALCAEHRWFAGKKVFFDGYQSFTAVQERLIGLMLSQGAEVTVTLTIGGEDSRFFVPRETEKRLRSLAYQAGESVPKPIVLTEPYGFASNALGHFAGEILRTGPAPFPGENDAVECAGLFHEFDEAEFAAARILHYAREDGYAFEEMAVLVRDMDKYAPLLEAAFERYGIPYTMDRVESVDILPLFRFCTHLIRAAASGNSREELLALLKCGVLEFPLEDAAAFESYTYVWNIDRGQFAEPFARNPSGFSPNPMTPKEEEELSAAESVRKLLNGWISAFFGAYERERSWPRALYRVLEQMDLPAKTAGKILSLQKENRQKDADDLRRSWEVLMDILSTMDKVLGEEQVDLREFSSLFSVCAAGYDLGRIPQTLDSVLVGSAERVRLTGKKAVLVLGANDREFPLLPSSGGIFTDPEREELVRLGLPLSGTADEKLLGERFVAWQALAAPTEKLTITYSLGNLKGEEKYPSAIVSGFQAIFPKSQVWMPGHFPPEFYCVSPRAAFLQAVRHGGDGSVFSSSVREYLSRDPEYGPRYRFLEEARQGGRFQMDDLSLARRMFGGQRTISPSQVEQFYQCRFRYFCRYGLGLRSRSKAQLDPLSRGSILHFLLEKALSRGDFFTMPEKELEALVAELLGQYLEEALGGEQQTRRFLYLYRRMEESALRVLLALRAEFAQTEFVIAGLEEPITPGGRIAPITVEVPGASITLTGKIDRIDLLSKENGKYVRVVDYKTGRKEFSVSSVAEGLNLQMLLYLFSIWRGGRGALSKAEPAGILYMPARPLEPKLDRYADETEQREALESGFVMNGLLLNDQTVLWAMEKDLKGRFLPVSMGKNKLNGEKYLASLGDFENLEWVALRLMEAMAGSLLAGEIAPDPISEDGRLPCEYCEFRAVCGHEDADACREVRKAGLDDIARIRRDFENGGMDDGPGMDS